MYVHQLHLLNEKSICRLFLIAKIAYLFKNLKKTVLFFLLLVYQNTKQKNCFNTIWQNEFTIKTYHECCAFLLLLEGIAEINFRCCASNPSRCSARLTAVSY